MKTLQPCSTSLGYVVLNFLFRFCMCCWFRVCNLEAVSYLRGPAFTSLPRRTNQLVQFSKFSKNRHRNTCEASFWRSFGAVSTLCLVCGFLHYLIVLLNDFPAIDSVFDIYWRSAFGSIQWFLCRNCSHCGVKPDFKLFLPQCQPKGCSSQPSFLRLLWAALAILQARSS